MKFIFDIFINSAFYLALMLNKKVISAMTIAGSDSSGGAGIQADLKAFASIGVHGTSTITCITAQNTKKVINIEPLPIEMIKSQFEAIMDDISPSHVKTGMLYSEKIVRFVADEIEKRRLIAIVDPVMVSTTGSKLSKDGFSNALIKNLIPVSTLITPNYDEAEELLGKKIRKGEEEDFCKELKKLGSRYVLLKGGHAKAEKVIDIFYDGKEIRRYESIRLGGGTGYHGTGCTLSALITGYLAMGLEVKTAIEYAKEHILKSIVRSYAPGKGVHMIDQLAPLFDDKEKLNILEKMRNMTYEIENSLETDMIPEVGTNFGYAKSHALRREDVCAFDGRIINIHGKVRVLSCPSFGASKHVASIILSAMKYAPEMRCAMNIRYSKDMLKSVDDAKLKCASFSRKEEPKENVSTMEWGTANAIERYLKENGKETFPDVIYDEGGPGKEPMIRVLARSPEELLEKVERIRKNYIKIAKRTKKEGDNGWKNKD